MPKRNWCYPEDMERFVKLLTPPSQLVLLKHLFQMYDRGVREWSLRDLEMEVPLHFVTIKSCVHRLCDLGVLRVSRINKFLKKFYELNMENEFVVKLKEVVEIAEIKDVVLLAEKLNEKVDGKEKSEEIEERNGMEEGEAFSYERFWKLMEASEK